MIFNALTPSISDMDLVHDALEEFIDKKKDIDYNDRFNVIVFHKDGPKYLEDFTLNEDHVMEALKQLEPDMTNANIAGGIFISATFVAEVYKKISGKVFRLIILTDEGTSRISDEHIFFIEDLLDKVRDIPFIMDIVRINIDDPREDLKLMKLARRTGGDIYEIEELYIEPEEIEEEVEFEIEEPKRYGHGRLGRVKKDRISKTTKRLARYLMGDSILKEQEEAKEKEAEEEANDLPAILNKLSKKKDVTYGAMDPDDKIEIPEQSLVFFESLADKPIEFKGEGKEKCTICFTSVSKNREMLQCPSCQSPVHKICEAIWAKTSNLGKPTPHLFRCHNCYNLLKLDYDLIIRVNAIQTPMIELFNIEDLLLEEYLESRETSQGPKIISSVDAFASSEEEEDEEEGDVIIMEEKKIEEKEEEKIESVSEGELQIIWCDNCGKMCTNEYLNCPQCDHLLREEEPVVEKIEDATQSDIIARTKVIAEINELKVRANSEYKLKNYGKAVKISEQILDIAGELEEEKIIREQSEFLRIAKKDYQQEQINVEAKKKLIYIKEKFNKLKDEEKFEEAHIVIEDFKKKNKLLLKETTLPIVQEFLEETEEVWKEYLEDREKYVTKSEDIEAEEPLTDKIDKELSETERELEKEQERLQNIRAQVDTINKAIKDSSDLVKKLEFSEAISILDSAADIIESKELSKYKITIAERKAEIKAAQNAFNLLYNEFLKLEESFTENVEKGNKIFAQQQCKKLVRMAKELKKLKLAEKYEKIAADMQKEIEKAKIMEQRELESLIKMEDAMKDIMKLEFTESSVLTLVETIPIKEAKQKYSEESEELMEVDLSLFIDVILSIFKEKRAELKSEIIHNELLISNTGEMNENQTIVPVKEQKINKKVSEDKFRETVNHQFEIVFENPFDEVMREANIVDIIPYNYKVIKIEIDGRQVKLPKKILLKEGVVLKWELKNIPANLKVKIKYSLEKRVSRMIIFTEGDLFKLIRTHYSIKDTEAIGQYEALLPFTISEDVELEWFVIEDLFPSYLIPTIIEPKDLTAVDSTISEEGNLVGWVYESMDPGTYLYAYRLLDSLEYDEIKANLGSLFKDGLEELERNDLIAAIKKAREISEIFKEELE